MTTAFPSTSDGRPGRYPKGITASYVCEKQVIIRDLPADFMDIERS